MNEELEKLEEEQSYEENSNDNPPNDIVAFNELRSCADLLRLHESGQLDIQPDFQREIVWSPAAQTRFIDSLIKQLPIPSMCISLDYRTNKRLIIDGLQRMQTIISFLSNDQYELSNIDDVDSRIAGKTVSTIKVKARDIYERVQNVTIPITVIRCDTLKKRHNEYLFTIFHRLNSGGTRLNNQEIRNCVYSGKLNNLIKEIANGDTWREFVNFSRNKAYRFANEEIILRVFAFIDKVDSYSSPLSKFLNEYMDANRNPDDQVIEERRDLIKRTIHTIKDKMLEGSSVEIIGGKTVLEGLLYGVATNIDKLNQVTSQKLKERFNAFKELPQFSIEKLKEGLSAREKVMERLNAAKNCFDVA